MGGLLMAAVNREKREGRSSSATDQVIKVLVALTIMALLVQGVLLLYWQATSLTERKPRKPRPTTATSAPGPRVKPSAFRLTSLFRPSGGARKGPGPAVRGATGGGVPVYELSKDQVVETYRLHFAEVGVRDEEYITLLALNHADRTWNAPMVSAQRAFEAGDLGDARQVLKDALANLDPRHLMARLKLLELLARVEFQAGCPEAGKRVQRDCDETRIAAAEILVRGLAENKTSGLMREDGERLLEALRDSKDARENLSSMAQLFSGEGEDPKKAPERIMNFLVKAGESADGVKAPGAAPTPPR